MMNNNCDHGNLLETLTTILSCMTCDDQHENQSCYYCGSYERLLTITPVTLYCVSLSSSLSFLILRSRVTFVFSVLLDNTKVSFSSLSFLFIQRFLAPPRSAVISICDLSEDCVALYFFLLITFIFSAIPDNTLSSSPSFLRIRSLVTFIFFVIPDNTKTSCSSL